ncbi:MAG TPA: GNAT family N-acetyltransferase [Arthrobacter sp.]|nr:GNAT family N-acetyltransferase [Arthrobacter sp.]
MDQLGYPNAVAALAPRLEQLLSHPEYAVWVAEGNDGSLHGLAVGHLVFPIEDLPAAHLTALVVDASARGTGLGRRLVEVFESWAGENGAARAVLTSAAHRAAAHAFYGHLGYEHTGQRFSKRLTGAPTGPSKLFG